MKLLAVSLAALLAVSMLPAAGSPLVSGHLVPRALPASDGRPVVRINGCHGDVRDAYIAEVGRRAPHYHLRGNCQPVLVEGDRETRRRPSADCHRDVRTHRVDGVMLRHRHVGDDCRIREVRSSSVGN
ncbi:hypothetical protein ACHMW7_12460 [Aminobacter sp. UC22_36]